MSLPVDTFLQKAYYPFRRLPDLLQALLDALVAQLGLAGATLRLHDTGESITSAAPSALAGGSSLVSRALPIACATGPIGELQWQWRHDEAVLVDAGFWEDFARRCAHLIRRYEVQSWAERRLGRPLLLVGVCEALHRLEIFVEKAASSSLPVLLKGEFGTEKAQLAVSVHCFGPRRDSPFIEVNCADPVGQPVQWFEQASGGTLFFNGIDELARPLQSQLPQHMHSRLGQWLTVPDAQAVRVVASATADLAGLVADGRFSRQLLAELDFLTVTVPPLRERPRDIRAMLVAALERHGFDSCRTCTDDLVRICQRHTWAENLFELERVVARLAVMNDGQPIHEAQVQRHAPWLLSAATADIGLQAVESPPPQASNRATRLPSPIPTGHWVRCAVTRDAGELGRLHAALRKALLYLGEHYAEPISLEQLAGQAHVSPSHLGFLFRSVLSTTFKPLLQHIRIEKAKEILSNDAGRRITEVALIVGFGDLSHFEKSFRRIVGHSPREFRRVAGV
ncbi:AraC family transcriptional regulator [Piscinibacter terrae]|uniref:AraC family transcriptional regulator n=1 Tax=Piscinibacter terrae TaxID=2496871 RepID=A0A3N7HMV6_9BURK|nr:AraC family transcriptional regulator [Albitalea terrae]RQP21981.1 AraC family transcriptional regulator [Albitalea terrae]